MPDLLIRNVPPELHARLKAAATAHRRSLTQEAIEIMASNLLPAPPSPRPLPAPTPHRETPHFIDDGRKNHSQPGWATDSLRIIHPVEGPAIPQNDWNMFHDDLDPLKCTWPSCISASTPAG